MNTKIFALGTKSRLISKKKRRKIPSESLIVEAVNRLLFEMGVERVFNEVQILEKFVDILAVSKKGSVIQAIEAKVNSPSRAFLQASFHVHFADEVFVAMLGNQSNCKARKLSIDTGIGLIIVEPDASGRFQGRIIETPRHARLKNAYLSNNVIRNAMSGCAL